MRRTLALVVILAGCASRSTSKEPGPAEAGKAHAMSSSDALPTGCAGASAALQATLASEPLASFVLPTGSGRQALTQQAVAPDVLLAIGRDATCPNPVRLAAFEGWIALAGEGVLNGVDDATAAAMAAVHAEALRTTEDAGAWALPPDVTSSAVSRHLIILGRRALPALRPLLDDGRALSYDGSEISAIASLRRYRVGDLAAGLIAVIVGQPYQDATTPAERDPQLASLRTVQ